jgi:hypothetical protein
VIKVGAVIVSLASRVVWRMVYVYGKWRGFIAGTAGGESDFFETS